jgi:hypothetical protein
MDIHHEFRTELCSLINRYSVDNYLNTPDFQVAEWLVEQIKDLRTLIATREEWHGRRFSFRAHGGVPPVRVPEDPDLPPAS